MAGDQCDECGGDDRFAVDVPWARDRPCGECERCLGHTPNLCTNPQIPPPGRGGCVDCTVAWLAQVNGTVPRWWVERRAKRLPEWAKQFVDRVPA